MPEKLTDEQLMDLHRQVRSSKPSRLDLIKFVFMSINPILRDMGSFSVDSVPKWQEKQEFVAAVIAEQMNLTLLESGCLSCYFVHRVWRNQMNELLPYLVSGKEPEVEKTIDEVLDDTFRANYFISEKNGDQYSRWLNGLKRSGKILGTYYSQKELPLPLVRRTLLEGASVVGSNRIDIRLSSTPRVKLSCPVTVGWV